MTGEHADRDHALLRLAELVSQTATEVQSRSLLADQIVADLTASVIEPSRGRAAAEMADAIRSGLTTTGAALAADAVVVRATVQTLRRIDELAAIAAETLGAIAGRAAGYLAPEVTLGGEVITAGLIEAGVEDRDELLPFVADLASADPSLLAHLARGCLADDLVVRTWLTTRWIPETETAGRDGLAAVGVRPFTGGTAAALRDVAGAFAVPVEPTVPAAATEPAVEAPHGLEELMRVHFGVAERMAIQPVGERRCIVYLPCRSRLATATMVAGDRSPYTAEATVMLREAVAPGSRVMLVGCGGGGVTAAELAASPLDEITVEEVITVGAPAAQVPRIPEGTHVLSLEDRSDPVAVLGSLVNTTVSNRLTVVFDAEETGPDRYIAGGRAADRARHPEILAALARLRTLGYLT